MLVVFVGLLNTALNEREASKPLHDTVASCAASCMYSARDHRDPHDGCESFEPFGMDRPTKAGVVSSKLRLPGE